MKKISKIWYIVGALAIIAVVAWLLSGNKKREEVAFTYAKVESTKIQNSITATGTVQPIDTVQVGTQVSGIVDKMYVDYNATVKKGQIIAELDKTNLISTLNTAKANLMQAKANYQSAKANLSYQLANFKRYQTLYKKGLVSANDFEAARLSYQQAIETANSNRQQIIGAQEAVNTAQTNLGYATITSPVDGIVLNKYVSEGQTVQANMTTPTLYTIARSLKDMQVIASVDEADIGDVKEGERVTFTVDAYPDETFEGTVKQVRISGASNNSVVTYSVVISAPNDDLKLKPGLTANVTIYTVEKAGVTCVPSKALRFTPTKETIGELKIVDNTSAKNKVWVVEGNTIKAVRVNIGMTDGTNTQILSGINLGKQVVTGISVKTDDEEANSNASGSDESPFGPKRPGQKKKSGNTAK